MWCGTWGWGTEYELGYVGYGVVGVVGRTIEDDLGDRTVQGTHGWERTAVDQCNVLFHHRSATF